MFTPQWESKGKAVKNLRGLKAELDGEREGGRVGKGERTGIDGQQFRQRGKPEGKRASKRKKSRGSQNRKVAVFLFACIKTAQKRRVITFLKHFAFCWVLH